MDKIEPKTIATIIVRPAYDKTGKPYDTASLRWIGELYVNGKRKYQTIDYDREGAAYVGVIKEIRRSKELLEQ